jgi:hypothetical protein
MPWRPEDAPRHTHKADTPRLCELWCEVANNVLTETGDEGRAVRAGNAAVARQKRRREDVGIWIDRHPRDKSSL